MKTVYIDSLFLLNLAINCLLLLASGRITVSETKIFRAVSGAAFGGVWAVAATVPKLAFLSLFPMKLLCAAVMSTITWGFGSGFLRRIFTMLAVTALFGGAVWAVYFAMGGRGRPETPGTGAVLMGAAACSAAVTVWCSRTPAAKKTTAEMTVELWGRSLRLKALLDSGNDLRDPLTSRPVVVLSRSEFAALLPPEYTAFLTDDPVESFGIFQQTPHGKSFRILSYKALGVESALLLAVRSDAVTVGPRRREGLLVACAPGEISEHGGYTALAGTEV